MTGKRFTDNGFEAIEEQSFTDNQTGKTYYVDYFDEIIDLLNELDKTVKELQGKYDKQLLLYNGLGCEYDWLERENEQLKKENKDLEDFRYGVFKSLSNFQEKMRDEEK